MTDSPFSNNVVTNLKKVAGKVWKLRENGLASDLDEADKIKKRFTPIIGEDRFEHLVEIAGKEIRTKRRRQAVHQCFDEWEDFVASTDEPSISDLAPYLKHTVELGASPVITVDVSEMTGESFLVLRFKRYQRESKTKVDA